MRNSSIRSMCRLFETIKILDGSVHNIEYHNERCNRVRAVLFGCSDRVDLRDFITIPSNHKSGVVKCKIVYSQHIESVEYTQYHARRIDTLRVINAADIAYAYKYLDRSGIDRLFGRRNGCDDIVIVRHGKITDSSFTNLVFDGGNKLLTPAEPLLKGTQRARLIAEGRITEEEIGLKDLRLFRSVHLINAMLALNVCTIGIGNIYR